MGPSSGEFSHLEWSLTMMNYVVCWCLLWCLLSTFRLYVATMVTNRAQLLGFSMLQPYGVYPLQAYVPHDDGLWSLPGVHWVAAPSAASSRGNLHATHSAVPLAISSIWGIKLWGLGRVTITKSLCISYMVRRGLLSQVVLHPVALSTQKIRWVLNLVNL